MSNVVDFLKPDDPHMTGQARCAECAHEWVAVAPTGTVQLECPSCASQKGLFVCPALPEGEYWECSCGCSVFSVLPGGILCYRCGTAQGFPE